MSAKFAKLVLVILGGFRSQDEYDMAIDDFYRGLSPSQSAQHIVNERQ
jgi:hypothetical protein